MPQAEEKWTQLLQKANSLPLSPGVYLMKDRNGKIIYVGKSRKLKNRVSQYFQNNKKNFKTLRMVMQAEDFDYILCKTEIEALSLENTLIKQYTPRYNIKLKDAKSYPYIKITSEAYPKLICTRSRLADKSKYFGPFSGTATVYSIMDILQKTLGIPSCKRSFPKDIGKDRPCIYYQMKQCCGLCTGKVSEEEYRELIRCATDILRGNINGAAKALEEQMLVLAEQEKFEAAASCRDTITALKRLQQKQSVVATPDTDADVFGLATDEFGICVSAMYVRDGIVNDKRDFSFSQDAIADSGALCAFLVEHYMMREHIPAMIFVSFDLDEADIESLREFLSQKAGHAVTIRKPERGVMKELTQVVASNAAEVARQKKLTLQQDESVLIRLAELLCLESIPERIEAYDISNLGSENITAGMVVYVNGKQQKSDYRAFHIKSIQAPDDYAAMREVITRRLEHLKNDTSGSFSEHPDILLIDGGKGHVGAVKGVLEEMGIDIPVFGMVKDDFHKTRALCTDQEEINIAKEKAIFMLIYKIQEEVHRFTVSKTMNAKRSTLKHSSLEKIHGIGPQKAKKLLHTFGTLHALKTASVEELHQKGGVSQTDAEAVYRYFHSK